jgi:group I intron endonuclease
MKRTQCETELERLIFDIGEGLYAIECSKNNRIYFGNTNDIRSRFEKHLWYLRRHKHPNRELQKDFIKYGESAFQYKMLIPTAQKQDRHYLEWLLIREAQNEGVNVYNIKIPIRDKYDVSYERLEKLRNSTRKEAA